MGCAAKAKGFGFGFAWVSLIYALEGRGVAPKENNGARRGEVWSQSEFQGGFSCNSQSFHFGVIDFGFGAGIAPQYLCQVAVAVCSYSASSPSTAMRG